MKSVSPALHWPVILSLLVLFFAGCGSSAEQRTVGGTLSGLFDSATISLQNNGVGSLVIKENGSFIFSGTVAAGSPYNVTVATQPLGQVCTVTNGSGTLPLVSPLNVTNISVVCIASLTSENEVFGAVTGLGTGLSVTLLNNGTDALEVDDEGFVFPVLYSSGTAYSVTVSVQPPGQTCVVTNGSGVIPAVGAIPAVLLTCS